MLTGCWPIQNLTICSDTQEYRYPLCTSTGCTRSTWALTVGCTRRSCGSLCTRCFQGRQMKTWFNCGSRCELFTRRDISLERTPTCFWAYSRSDDLQTPATPRCEARLARLSCWGKLCCKFGSIIMMLLLTFMARSVCYCSTQWAWMPFCTIIAKSHAYLPPFSGNSWTLVNVSSCCTLQSTVILWIAATCSST